MINDWTVCLPGGDVITMLPVSRFKVQPVGMVTTATPWLYISSDPNPHWLSLASWSAAMYHATAPVLFYPPAVWTPEHTQLIQVTHTFITGNIHLIEIAHT